MMRQLQMRLLRMRVGGTSEVVLGPVTFTLKEIPIQMLNIKKPKNIFLNVNICLKFLFEIFSAISILFECLHLR